MRRSAVRTATSISFSAPKISGTSARRAVKPRNAARKATTYPGAGSHGAARPTRAPTIERPTSPSSASTATLAASAMP